MEGKTIPLPHRDCSDIMYESCHMMRDDTSSSHLPLNCQPNGVPLCRIHYDVYMAPRGSTMCSKSQCREQGTAAPDGAICCSSHIADALKPPAHAAKVSPKSPSVKSKKAPKGLETPPLAVLSFLYTRLSEEGLAESEVVDRLTKDYGGGLLDKARVVRSLTDDAED